MAALEIQGNGDSGHLISEECIQKTLDVLEDLRQKVIQCFYKFRYIFFINICFNLLNISMLFIGCPGDLLE